MRDVVHRYKGGRVDGSEEVLSCGGPIGQYVLDEDGIAPGFAALYRFTGFANENGTLVANYEHHKTLPKAEAKAIFMASLADQIELPPE